MRASEPQELIKVSDVVEVVSLASPGTNRIQNTTDNTMSKTDYISLDVHSENRRLNPS